MSSIYNTEPQPTASVVLQTTLGDISVELFAKQTPLTSRNFLQHCLDGYYDNTIFHRLVPGFIIQGGDPTGTGHGGESIYDGGALSGDLDPWPMDQRRGQNAGMEGINFKDEIHSRLKFNRRGLLGMANDSTPDSNGSQFFFTLDKAEELNGKNTMFGRVSGNTIYNLAKMGEAELAEGTERPLYPIKITGVEILVNPFDDMRKRERVVRQTEKLAAPAQKKRKKPKGGKQLLSFGDEVGEAEDTPVFKKPKFDTRIVMDAGDDEDEAPKKPKKKAAKKAEDSKHTLPVREAPAKSGQPSANTTSEPVRSKAPSYHSESESSSEPDVARKSQLEKANEEFAALKASMRRTVHAEAAPKEKKKSALEQMIPETSTKGRKRRVGGAINESEEKATLDMLNAFRSRLESAPVSKDSAAAHGAGDGQNGEAEAEDEAEVCDLHFIANCQSCQSWDKLEDKEESDDEGWMSHALSFAADKLGKDLNQRKKAEDELIVIDPREKARTLKEDQRAKREARSGGSGRAWDEARNAQLARNAATAGRGAK